MIVVAIVIAVTLWLLRSRFRDWMTRAYGLFFLVLLFFVLNKGEGSASIDELAAGTFSPLSLARWALLGLLLFVAARVPRPDGMKRDAPLTAFLLIFFADILLSTFEADDFSYSLMRAVSFIAMAVAAFTGLAHHLYWRANCVRFFKLHYYLAWCVLGTAMLLYLTGLGQYGATLVMGQYAGPFGNQNLLGIFSGLMLPYALFHWRTESKGRTRTWWIDLGLVAMIVLGAVMSRSRGGMLACLIATAAYFFVVSPASRVKIAAAALCGVLFFAALPSLQGAFTRFIRKDTIERAEVSNVREQFYEERRYELWSGVLPLYWERKLTGYGFASSHSLTFPFSGDKEAGRHVHNSYLELFGDLGLPGVILLLLIFGRLALKSVALIQRRENELQGNINAVFIAVFAAGAVNALFESWMFSVGNIIALMFWAPMAGLVGQSAWAPAVAPGHDATLPLTIGGRGGLPALAPSGQAKHA